SPSSRVEAEIGGVRPDQQKVQWTFCPAERRSGARPSAPRGREEIKREREKLKKRLRKTGAVSFHISRKLPAAITAIMGTAVIGPVVIAIAVRAVIAAAVIARPVIVVARAIAVARTVIAAIIARAII